MAAQSVASELSLAERLVRAREAAGLTTAQLARRVGIRTRTLGSWESGRAAPRANRLMTLAGVLDVAPAWLIGGEGTTPAGGHGEIALVRGELRRLRASHEATGQMIDRLESHLETLASKLQRDS